MSDYLSHLIYGLIWHILRKLLFQHVSRLLQSFPNFESKLETSDTPLCSHVWLWLISTADKYWHRNRFPICFCVKSSCDKISHLSCRFTSFLFFKVNKFCVMCTTPQNRLLPLYNTPPTHTPTVPLLKSCSCSSSYMVSCCPLEYYYTYLLHTHILYMHSHQHIHTVTACLLPDPSLS